MKILLNLFATLFALAAIVVLLAIVDPKRFFSVIENFSALEFYSPNCSDKKTTDLLFELFSKEISEISDKGHLSKDNFLLQGITTISSENQNGRFYPTRFACQAYLNIDIPPKALNVISELRKKERSADDPLVQDMGLSVLFGDPDLLASASAINIENNHISQPFMYTTQIDDASTYQSISAAGLKPVAMIVAFLSANGISVESQNVIKDENKAQSLPNDQRDQTTEMASLSQGDKLIVSAAVDHFFDVVKEGGIDGIKSEIEDCYANVFKGRDIRGLTYCIALDTEATALESADASLKDKNYMPDEYFGGSAYETRVRENLAKIKIISTDKQNVVINAIKSETSIDARGWLSRAKGQDVDDSQPFVPTETKE